MDGKGRWMDNVFIERLWRSLKYECVYLHAFQDGLQARQAIDAWLRYYNEERPHSFLTGDRTPMKELILARFGGHEDKVVLSSSTYGRF
jgi:putative transposase